MEKVIKFGMAFLLFLCLADMPYGYFQFVRWVGLVVFALFAFEAREKNRHQEVLLYLGLAILFQPIIKIALGRGLWNLVDIIVGGYLLFSAINNKKKIFKG